MEGRRVNGGSWGVIQLKYQVPTRTASLLFKNVRLFCNINVECKNEFQVIWSYIDDLRALLQKEKKCEWIFFKNHLWV